MRIDLEPAGPFYSMVSFDSRGNERVDDPRGGTQSPVLLSDLTATRPANIFIMIHGWKGDVRAAEDQFTRWFGALHRQVRKGDGSSVYYIGIHWPSKPWGDESLGTDFAPPGAISDLLDSFSDDEEAHRLAEKIVQESEDVDDDRWLEHAVALAERLELTGDPSSPDGSDGPAFTVETLREALGASDNPAFGLGDFSPLTILSQLSFWTMKKRARTVGENGVHSLLGAVLAASPRSRVHLMGHSLGCIVVSGALRGPTADSALPRAVSSVAFIQGALSLWAYAPQIALAGDRPGYFSSVLAGGRVSGCIIATLSAHDTAVGVAYKVSAMLAGDASFDRSKKLPKFGGIGSFGIQGLASVSSLSMHPESQVYSFQAGGLYNLESTEFVLDHNAIDGPEVAHAIYSASLVTP